MNELEQIRLYLDGQLNGDGLKVFEKRLGEDEAFRREVESLRVVSKGIEELRDAAIKVKVQAWSKAIDSKYPHEEYLYKRIKDGDEKLQKELFNQYRNKFHGFIIKKKHKLDKDAIQDIYVNAFIIFLKNIITGKLKLPLRSTLETYLFAIGLKEVLKHFDRLKRNKEYPTEDIENLQKDQAENELEKKERLEKMTELLKKILSKCSEECRKLLELWFKGYSDEAIAREMNIASQGAVRQRRFKCIKNIKDDDDLRDDFEDLF